MIIEVVRSFGFYFLFCGLLVNYFVEIISFFRVSFGMSLRIFAFDRTGVKIKWEVRLRVLRCFMKFRLYLSRVYKVYSYIFMIVILIIDVYEMEDWSWDVIGGFSEEFLIYYLCGLGFFLILLDF